MHQQHDLINVIQALSTCRDLDSIVAVLRGAARRLTGADGITVVLRDGDNCHYAEEDAVGPLWKGRRFPMKTCISGWCMLNAEAAVIEDIYDDPRIPHDAYRPTFVKSLAMVPIRKEEPIGAIGAYWKDNHLATEDELAVLEALGGSASTAFANVQLIAMLNDANRRKDEFISMLGHELRNPLAPIRNALQLIQRSPGKAPAEVCEMMERQIRHLVRIVDDLLDASRVANGQIVLKSETVDLGRLLRECLADRQTQFKKAGLILDTSGLDGQECVVGDPTRLTQIFANIIDNSIKFTPAGGRVAVALSCDDGYVKISIADNGEGIDGKLLSQLFETFAQADRSLARTKGGLGLGLSIVRGLTVLHGGSVEVQSKGTGQGATFTVTLPLAAEKQAAADAARTVKTNGTGKVLVIEDNRDAAETLRALLQIAGFDAAIALDGPEGIAAAEKILPDAIVCDLGLPGMDGYAVAEALRTKAALKHAKLIAVTGYGREEDKEKTAKHGFHFHLVKPVEPDELIETIRSAILNRES